MPALRVLVTGATGFIGGCLVRALVERGDDAIAQVRDAAQRSRFSPSVRVVLDTALETDLGHVDAVVHLAGERAVGVRWTQSAKQRIRESRVATTEHLVRVFEGRSERPSVFVCASAVGYYGARTADETLDESAEAGSDFLAEVCKEWEAAAERATALGIRVVRARLGVVFGPGGGALEEMVKPFRLYAGGPIGSGEQVVSWVHVDDVVGMLLRTLDDPKLSGAVNVVSPNPVPQAELARALGKVLGRPSWLRVPAAALRARFGEGAGPLLTGQRVVPLKMKQAGYVWHHPELSPALASALA